MVVQTYFGNINLVQSVSFGDLLVSFWLVVLVVLTVFRIFQSFLR